MPTLMTARYTAGVCRLCSAPILEGQQIQFYRPVNPGARGYSVHAMCEAAQQSGELVQPVAPPVTSVVVRLPHIVDFFARATAAGLRRVQLRFAYSTTATRENRGIELRVKLSPRTGVLYVYAGHSYVGRIDRYDGTFSSRTSVGASASLVARLQEIDADVVSAARHYGALTNSCCFCGLTLTDAGSVAAGYGPVCATHYNLPHASLGSSLSGARSRAGHADVVNLVSVSAAPYVAARVRRSTSRAAVVAPRVESRYQHDVIDDHGEA